MKRIRRIQSFFHPFFSSRFMLPASRFFGFTMIELLVVIAILGILVAVGVASFSTAQKTTRDSRRKQDMKTISSALELYYAQNNAYPDAIGTITNTTYLQEGRLPQDPKNSGSYIYTNYISTNSSTGYCACALLENTTGGNSTISDCTNFATGMYYCVRNAQ